MKNKVFTIIFCIVLILIPRNSVAANTTEQVIKDTAKIAENMLKWSPGKLIIKESLQGTIIEESMKGKRIIPFALLIYRNSSSPWRIMLNQTTFKQWQDFLAMQKGRWPEEGTIIIITDKEKLTVDIPLDVPAFTQTFGTPQEKFTITVISITRIRKQKAQARPANFSDKTLFEAITAAEICNTMFIKLQGEERDKLCVSLGMTIGAIRIKLTYKQYQEKISKVKILSGVNPFIFSEYDYLKLGNLFREGPIIELQPLQ